MIAVKICDTCALAAKGETSGVVGTLENTGAYEKCEFHEGGIETVGDTCSLGQDQRDS